MTTASMNKYHKLLQWSHKGASFVYFVVTCFSERRTLVDELQNLLPLLAMEDQKSPDPWSTWSDVMGVLALVGMGCSDAFTFKNTSFPLNLLDRMYNFHTFVCVCGMLVCKARGAYMQRCGASIIMPLGFHVVCLCSAWWWRRSPRACFFFSSLGLGQQNKFKAPIMALPCLTWRKPWEILSWIGVQWCSPDLTVVPIVQFVHAKQISTSSRTSFRGRFWSTPSFPPSFVPAAAWSQPHGEGEKFPIIISCHWGENHQLKMGSGSNPI